MVLSGEINRITGQNITIMLVRVLSEVLMDLNKLKKRVAELEENLNENANINEIVKGDQK